MYYCTDTSNLYIDYQESRFQINANFSNGLHYLKDGAKIELDAETLVSAINSKSTIYFGDTQPENLTEQDLWIQFLSDNKSQLSYVDANGIVRNIFPITKKENVGIYVTADEPTAINGDIWLDLDADASETLPTTSFNLIKLGFPTIPVEGNAVTFETDLTEIEKALKTGFVQFRVKLSWDGYTYDTTMHMTVLYENLLNEYHCSYVGGYSTGPINSTFLTFNISNNLITGWSRIMTPYLEYVEKNVF